jgi:hypothetical protein
VSSEFSFNGINGADGDYLLTVQSDEELLAEIAPPSAQDAAEARHLAARARTATAAPRDGVDPRDLAQAGWGIVFADDVEDDAIAEALAPLLQIRRAQASKVKPERYREYRGADGYAAGESARDFLRRHKIGSGAADPDLMPYYMMVVGSPERIPYRFQYQLDVQRAVGRLWFPSLDGYAEYARRVVAHEAGSTGRRSLTFFGPSNPDDPATRLSSTELLAPLAELLDGAVEGWTVETRIGETATKAALAETLSGASRPGLLFTASHGLGFPAGHADQERLQGALLCQDWPGPRAHRGAIPGEMHFSADDIAAGVDLDGLIAVHFACYSAGTPQRDDFPGGRPPAELADRAFVAALPAALLHAGALAVVGHVDRAWGCSFMDAKAGRQTATFEDLLKRLMNGFPIGWALELMNLRYAELAAQLNDELQARSFGDPVDPRLLVSLWTESNDARNYSLLGDPAVQAGHIQ